MQSDAIQWLDRSSTSGEHGCFVWSCDLDRLGLEVPDVCSSLSEDERKQAERFRSDVHRTRYLASRYFERLILGTVLRLPPQGVPIRRTAQGKPFVPGSELYHNLSHSENMAVLAVGSRQLGIDVEHLREVADVTELARRFLHPNVARVIGRLPLHRRSPVFLEHWTMCEAVLKATGQGLQGHIEDFAFHSERGPQVIADGKCWRVYSIDPGAGLTGALAIAH